MSFKNFFELSFLNFDLPVADNAGYTFRFDFVSMDEITEARENEDVRKFHGAWDCPDEEIIANMLAVAGFGPEHLIICEDKTGESDRVFMIDEKIGVYHKNAILDNYGL